MCNRISYQFSYIIEFEHFATSGMDNASYSGILRGRPFGGICFLWRKSIAKWSLCCLQYSRCK